MDAQTNAVAWRTNDDPDADAEVCVLALASTADPMLEFDALLRHLRQLAERLRDDPLGADAPLPGHLDQGAGLPRRATAADDAGSLEREVLLLLAAGATDASIARQLGISGRTVQRRVRALMDGLGVQTRFQAGVQAALRHWC